MEQEGEETQIKGRVAFVDDEPALGRSFKRLLGFHGYEVDIFETPSDFLVRFKEKHDDYSMILLDITMPAMGGIELLNRIRREDQEIPVYLVTGNPLGEMPDPVANCNGVIRKPFKGNEILTLIGNIDEIKQNGRDHHRERGE